jgi:hypothetical protein
LVEQLLAELLDRTADRPWRILAKAIHGSGTPILTVDAAATPAETACQMELVAYRHGYLTGNEPELPRLLAAAYPEAINRIKRSARLERTETAVALPLDRLLHPGFDPVRGTNSSRRYINRIARTVALEHLKTERAEFRPWETLGLKERQYYKLLARYAHKAGRRYEVDDSVRLRIREHVEAAERATCRNRASRHAGILSSGRQEVGSAPLRFGNLRVPPSSPATSGPDTPLPDTGANSAPGSLTRSNAPVRVPRPGSRGESGFH